MDTVNRCPWDWQTGLIGGPLIKSAVAGLPAPIDSDVAGPSGLVDAMRQTLVGAGADDDDIRGEGFYGY